MSFSEEILFSIETSSQTDCGLCCLEKSLSSHVDMSQVIRRNSEVCRVKQQFGLEDTNPRQCLAAQQHNLEELDAAVEHPNPGSWSCGPLGWLDNILHNSVSDLHDVFHDLSPSFFTALLRDVCRER